jgi:hypothetical protein
MSMLLFSTGASVDKLGALQRGPALTSWESQSAGMRSKGGALPHFIFGHYAPQQRLEEASTEAPSGSSSDAESAGSSSCVSDLCADDEMRADIRSQGKQPLGHARASANSRPQRRSRRAHFTKTALEPIPGTPVGMNEAPPLIFPQDLDPGRHFETSPGFPRAAVQTPSALGIGLQHNIGKKTSRKGLLATTPKIASDALNDKQECAMFLARAKINRLPLKISALTSGELLPERCLDPDVPAKKRPLFLEGLNIACRLQPGVPAKKRVTPWMTAEPVYVVVATPR